jgi:hypothetical protein
MALLHHAPAHVELRPDAFAISVARPANRAAAIAAVTKLYREVLPPGGAILDLMSGWVMFAPEIPYSRVVGVRLNSSELAENPFSTMARAGSELRSAPAFATAEFDGAAICVASAFDAARHVIHEAGRVLKPLR